MYLLEELNEFLNVENEWDDLDDGADDWVSLISRIEERFGDSWSLVVACQGPALGRCFTRPRHVLGDREFEPSTKIGCRLYLYGCEELEAVSSVFLGSVCYEVHLDCAETHQFHISGRDENAMKSIASLLGEQAFDTSKCVVIRNPDGVTKLSWLKLQDKYSCAVLIDGDEQLATIRSLDRALEVPSMLERAVRQAATFVDYYQLKRFAYVDEFCEKLEKEREVIRGVFEKQFCL